MARRWPTDEPVPRRGRNLVSASDARRYAHRRASYVSKDDDEDRRQRTYDAQWMADTDREEREVVTIAEAEVEKIVGGGEQFVHAVIAELHRTGKLDAIRTNAYKEGYEQGLAEKYAPTSEDGRLGDAMRWLEELLADGRRIRAAEMERLARAAGHTEATMKRAISELGVKSHKCSGQPPYHERYLPDN